MKNAKVTVTNETGLHARPAAFFVQIAQEFSCEITIKYENRSVDAKSLLEILSLGVTKGSKIEIIADGSDEDKAISKLLYILDHGLQEIA